MKKTFVYGFIIGGLAGAATALLTAPQSGEETRNQIKETGEDALMRAEAELNDLQAHAEATVSRLQNEVDGLVASAEPTYITYPVPNYDTAVPEHENMRG